MLTFKLQTKNKNSWEYAHLVCAFQSLRIQLGRILIYNVIKNRTELMAHGWRKCCMGYRKQAFHAIRVENFPFKKLYSEYIKMIFAWI